MCLYFCVQSCVFLGLCVQYVSVCLFVVGCHLLYAKVVAITFKADAAYQTLRGIRGVLLLAELNQESP